MGEIRFVGTGETRGYPYLVCKRKVSQILTRFSFLSEPQLNCAYLKVYSLVFHYEITAK